jgi:hypothetical protein
MSRTARKLASMEPEGQLLSLPKAAEHLGLSDKTLREHVRAGDIRYVLIGQGRKRKHRMFASEDLAEFVESRRRRDAKCQSTSPLSRRSTNMTSGSKVIDFAALLD